MLQGTISNFTHNMFFRVNSSFPPFLKQTLQWIFYSLYLCKKPSNLKKKDEYVRLPPPGKKLEGYIHQ